MEQKDKFDISSYYYFDDANKEVCFKRYDMPSPWMNYFSNGTFHTMMSQAGGGVTFYKSPQIWRISRYRFFNLPTDRSGPYFYIQDAETGAYWCPTAEPCALKPEKWAAAHGMGYSRYEAEQDGISAVATYFVGPYADALIWNVKLKNVRSAPKKLRIFPFVELAMMEFMRELQWQCYNKHQLSVDYLDSYGALVYKYGVENQPRPDQTPLVYFAADRMPVAYDGDRDEFIGSYRSEEKPAAIEEGGCTNSTLAGGDPCFALQFDLTLAPGQEETFQVFMGTAMTREDVEKAIVTVREEGFVEKSFAALKESWDGYLSHFHCELPDKDAERMINIWNPYQAQRNFLFSRNISYYATGTFRGVGFRDTSQDVLAQVPFDLAASKEKIKLLLSQQYKDGHVNHYFFPTEGWDPVTTIHSDDHLWPIMSVWAVLQEEGSLDFLNEEVEYYDGGKGTIYEHLQKSIDFTMHNLGRNGFPLMLRSDWNDQLFRVCREGKGESIWTSMQFGVVLQDMEQIATLMGDRQDAREYRRIYEDQKERVNSIAWDGKWFRRAVMDNGQFLGSDVFDEAKIWLNAQTWAIISGMGEQEKSVTAMNSVKEMLDTPLGVKKIHPSIVNFPSPEDPLTNYNPGTGENGSVFCHANTWAIIAEALLKRPENAYKYYRQLIPAIAMQKAGIWRYKAEPYVYASNLFGPESKRFGLANVSWLTGTAAWMYVAFTQYILGIRTTWEGLMVDPCIPEDWNDVVAERDFRGCRYEITLKNEGEKSNTVDYLEVDGKRVDGNVIPHVEGRKAAKVVAHIR